MALNKLFEIKSTPSFNKNALTKVKDEKFAYVTRTSLNNGVLKYTGFINETNINEANTFSLGLLQMNFFYQKTRWYAGQFVRKIIPKFEINESLAKYFGTILNKQRELLLSILVREVDKTFNTIEIDVPIHKNGKIAFDYMEAYIKALESEKINKLESYLTESGLNDCELTKEESDVVKRFNHGVNIMWSKFSVLELFGKSTRGKRLKSQDRISGDLPFVTAGESMQGVSAFIGNDVHQFNSNTATIDMFGSAKYRSYEYGCDDHIAVVHTESLTKYASIFVTTSLNKAANTGKFDYSHNFYAKDADELMIELPILKNKNPDYAAMDLYMRGIEKLIIKRVIKWKNSMKTEITE